MSPESYKERVRAILNDMLFLYKAASDNPVLGHSLFYLNRSMAVLDCRRVVRDEERSFHRPGSRDYIGKSLALFKKHKQPMTVQQLLKRLKAGHPEYWDVQYRTFHPNIRSAVRRPCDRQLAECGTKAGKKLYCPATWKRAQDYTPLAKCGS